VLDRGERDDWLGSHFITSFLAIALVAIAVAIWWEWNSRDPVVELTLLRERNFAIANVYYFLFAFGLFGSTVLIPEMLQTLFGYTATDAGLVLGPGAAVITLLAPFVVRIVPRVGAKRLLAASFTIAALSMFYYSGLTSQTDYFHFALARVFQGFGYAFMFVPVSQLAYSYLPRNKNNKGSSLTNLCRNWGGSFGIAFVTTMLERRTQYHQSVLVSNITSADGAVRQFVTNSSHYQRPRCDPPSLWAGRKPDDSAGDLAGVHGLLSPVGPRRDSGPTAGLSNSTFPNRRRSRSRPLRHRAPRCREGKVSA
jgi:DHA2 family multidrug resistance protein